MNPVWIIAKKRDGEELTADEIGALHRRLRRGDIPDYQMSALAMAIYLRGMTTAEIAALTDHMLASGRTFTWPAGGPPKVDKHSTGGIGDKVSLPLAPMLACCGLQVPMISGRGLGATGGTLDKLEAIPGFRTNLSMDEMRDVCRTGRLRDQRRDGRSRARRPQAVRTPRRDRHRAVDSADHRQHHEQEARRGTRCAGARREVRQRRVHENGRASPRARPFDGQHRQADGRLDHGAVHRHEPAAGPHGGQRVEVDESVAALEGQGPADLMEVTLALGAELLVLTKARALRLRRCKVRLQKTIDSGAGREKFGEMVAAQGRQSRRPAARRPGERSC